MTNLTEFLRVFQDINSSYSTIFRGLAFAQTKDMANKYQKIMEELGGFFISNSQTQSPLFTEEQLGIEEAQLDYSLPKDYREFLHDYSCFSFDFVHFPILAEGLEQTGNIDGFYGKNIATGYHATNKSRSFDLDLYSGLRLIRSRPIEKGGIGWPPELLSIAFDSVGNEVCLALFGLRPGAIFYWRSFAEPDEQNVYLIADSFDEFMHLLRKSE